jgi:hypothetical protein
MASGIDTAAAMQDIVSAIGRVRERTPSLADAEVRRLEGTESRILPEARR